MGRILGKDPEGKVHNVSVYSGHTLKPEDFVTNIVDATAVTVTMSPEPDLTKEAQSLITVTLTAAQGDTLENPLTITIPLTVA